MKIAHFAILAVLLLLGSVVALLWQTDRDKELSKMQAAINALEQEKRSRVEENQRQNAAASAVAPAPVPTPAANPAPAPVPAPAATIPVPTPGGTAAAVTDPALANVPTPTPTVPPVPADPAAGTGTIPGTVTPGLSAPAAPGEDPAAIAAREQELMKENLAGIKQAIKETERLPDDLLNPKALKIRKLPSLCKVADVQEEHGFVVLDAGGKVGLTPGLGFSIRRDHWIVGKIRVTEVKDDATAVADILSGSVPLGVSLQKGDEIVKLDE